ncbi:hypothetical protein VTP01DRAFT_9826 [Rhizomucor pusillus]|uniref:uncharacterized protein n=1 Tax=Rhizomucor pusillus TaxID=4840 RepID=UPI0037420BB3
MLFRRSQPVLLTVFILLQACLAANPVHFCKCFCGSNSTIFEIPIDNPKPCSNCTKQFCLDNVEDGLCDGIADETCPSNDFLTACFARDSFKDQSIVVIFLVLTGGLLCSAVLKPYIANWRAAPSRNSYNRLSGTDI